MGNNQTTQTEKTKSLQKSLQKPDKEIIATWSRRDKEAIYAHCGIKFPPPKNPPPGELKIKDYTTGTQVTNLIQTLFGIQRYKGAASLMTQFEVERLANFLQKEFDDFTIPELWCAIDMASAADNPFKLEYGGITFGEFTNDYLTRILSPYRPYRASLLHRYHTASLAADVLGPDGATGPSRASTGSATDGTGERDKYADETRLCLTAFDGIKNKCPQAGLNKVYDILRKRGIIEFTEDRLKEFAVTAKSNMKAEERNSGRIGMIQALEKGLPVGKITLMQETKRVAVTVYFNDMVALGEELADRFELKNEGIKELRDGE